MTKRKYTTTDLHFELSAVMIGPVCDLQGATNFASIYWSRIVADPHRLVSR
jgi:hypothetical protein